MEQNNFKEENIKESIEKEGEMAIRRRIKGKCYEVRERNTSAGKKGTIIRKCQVKKIPSRRLIPKRVVKKFFA